MRLCTETGKRKYPTKIRALVHNADRPITARAYKCPACGFWHITRKPQ